MRRSPLLVLVGLLVPVFVPSPARQLHALPPVMARQDSASWLGAFIGTHACSGAFATGKALSADVTFRPVLGGRWLEYHHRDRPPGRYEAQALVGPVPADSGLKPTVLLDNLGGERRFLTSWNPDSGLVLRRDSTDAGAYPERFIFRPRAGGGFWFAWEVQRPGNPVWAIGDSLSCGRAQP